MNERVISIQIPTLFFEGPSNAYLLEGDPLTLIDTGIFGETPLRALELRLGEHGHCIERIERIVLTHKHADHMGLAAEIKNRSGAEVYVHQDDHRSVLHYESSDVLFRKTAEEKMVEWGAPAELLHRSAAHFKDRVVMGRDVNAIPLTDGERLPMSGSPLEVIHSPGHTRGSACIRWGRHLFSGDHVLPDITPNVGIGELGGKGMLKVYLQSLEKVKSLQTDDLIVYPGHGEPFRHFADRAEEIIRHHDERIGDIERILSHGRPMSIYDLALRLFGELRGFHLVLGTAEAHAHLDLLEERNRVRRDEGGFRACA